MSGTGLESWRCVAAVMLAVELLCSSCVSVRALPPALAGDAKAGATVRVRIYETTGARKSGLHTVRTVISELWREEGRDYVLVREAREAEWTAAELPPGRFRVNVDRWVDGNGNEQRLASSDRVTFTVAGGERVDVEVVLKHPRRVVIGVVIPVVIIGLGALALHNWSPLGSTMGDWQ